MTMTPGLVSTIIPVFNRAVLLREAVASVLAQTWRPIEVVVVDDGSTDDTPQVVDQLARDHAGVVTGIHQQNAGPGLARQRGMEAVSGEFIQYLDSDDLLLPGKFESQVKALRDAPGAGAAYGFTRFRNADGTAEATPWKGSGDLHDAMFPSMLTGRWWDTGCALFRRDVCERAGRWSDLRLQEDWEYDCRIAALGTRLVRCDEFVCEVRDHDGPRIGPGSAGDARRLAERARSHEMILASARRAGIASDLPEMRHFARALFLLARQCGAAGLAVQSQRLFELSLQASATPLSRAGADRRAYALLSRVFGWSAMGRASQWLDRVRNHAKA
jgi:glycosyltransferase involved in cell wall biosynthesis